MVADDYKENDDGRAEDEIDGGKVGPDDGGKVEPFDGGKVQFPSYDEPKFDVIKHETITSAYIALALVGFFAFVVVGHYVTLMVMYLTGHDADAEKMATHFNILFPVLSGFVGSAITYYFTRE